MTSVVSNIQIIKNDTPPEADQNIFSWLMLILSLVLYKLLSLVQIQTAVLVLTYLLLWRGLYRYTRRCALLWSRNCLWWANSLWSLTRRSARLVWLLLRRWRRRWWGLWSRLSWAWLLYRSSTNHRRQVHRTPLPRLLRYPRHIV
jgi:hypothetical protein